MIRVTMRLRGGGVACFGILVERDPWDEWRVTDAAPIARWAVGRDARSVWAHYEGRGRVEWLGR